MALTKQLVSLGLALRGRKKLRVRQPLASVTIGVVLPEYFIDILKEELNVKEVFQGADMSQVAKLVCRPNARLIGPRFGKQVQEIIVSAKSGAFTLLDDGSVRVGDAVLAVGEFELVYEPISSEFDVEGGGGQVILMDTCITQALRDEGIARDAVRTIQDLRKEADYAVSDRVELFISGGQEIREALEKNREYILGETLADNLFFEETDTSDIQTGVMFEETEVKFALKRVAR
jgi:isoleucyl-tRNA synthetase